MIFENYKKIEYLLAELNIPGNVDIYEFFCLKIIIW